MTDPRIEAAAKELKRLFSESDAATESMWVACAETVLAAADAAAWRPIATAPTDSSEVLVWDGDSVFMAGRMGEYWWSDVEGIIDNPTHWQPLPAPPASIDALGGVDG
ncbi:DUF551 domain-containing protein [Acetobacter cerevisiae]|uniref:DUF551 domain-containing protein n=1 Tax=Acetobacter cerevisiae TaxID=178900 RepID=UPI00209E18A7|nr:DUF551 domain-containing protein [Acetobacter cerevisiae]MCP1271249.1 DUF551 domain-containing protein [Acetobacter cerevisiae]MCP1279203.1 DUF551 domain-containing protein [Acetobacter cerevisiae]